MPHPANDRTGTGVRSLCRHYPVRIPEFHRGHEMARCSPRNPRRAFIPAFVMLATHWLLLPSALAGNSKNDPSTDPSSCVGAADRSWSQAERWAWRAFCAGDVADFNRAARKKLDPTKPGGWSRARMLDSRFFEQIFTDPTYRDRLPRSGVRIIGAWFRRPLNLTRVSTDRPLAILGSRFESDIRLDYSTTSDLIDLRGSSVGGMITGDLLHASGGPALDGCNLEKGMRLSHATLYRLSLDHCQSSAAIDLDAMELTELAMHTATVHGGFDARFSKIANQLTLLGSTIEGPVNLDGVQASIVLISRAEHPTRVQTLKVNVASIKTQLELGALIATGDVSIARTTIGGDLLMPGVNLNAIDIGYSQIGGSIAMVKSSFSGEFLVEGSEVDGRRSSDDRC
jgi:hypothetical protein